MHADICTANDAAAVDRFRDVLRRLDAQPGDKGWFTGCDLYPFTIGTDQFCVTRDEWSVTIEGPDVLVKRIVSDYAEANL
jgi:hypothetical protein